MTDIAQLTKANSITGNKQDNITIIYTPWTNLKKTGDMVDGQVGFKKDKLVKKVFVDTRINPVINRLNKTREEHFPDLEKERQEYDIEKKRNESKRRQQQKKMDQELAKERAQLAYQKDHAYDDLFTEENMRHASNDNRAEDFEDDFM